MTSRTIDRNLVTELSHMDTDFLRSMTYAMAYFKTHCQPHWDTGTGNLTDLEHRQMVSAQAMLMNRLSIMGCHVREMESILNRHKLTTRRRERVPHAERLKKCVERLFKTQSTPTRICTRSCASSNRMCTRACFVNTCDDSSLLQVHCFSWLLGWFLFFICCHST